jgi:hypothetical protein
MSTLVCSLQGRFGNQCMQWLFAYAFAQKNGMVFLCDEWIGERVFALPEYKRPWAGAATQRVNEKEIYRALLDFNHPDYKCVMAKNPKPDLEFRGYAQHQDCMIYTKREAMSWLRFRPEIEGACRPMLAAHMPIVAHYRKGDYIGYGYPVMSSFAYINACLDYGLDPNRLWILSEEFFATDKASWPESMPTDLWFVVDFYRMVNARTLLRANSSFSWLAGLLSNGIVLSPRIDGLAGGIEHTAVKFEVGNHCKLSDHDFCTDLHVAAT